MNLKRPSQIAPLSEEIEHVSAYLQIELARFSDRLSVDIDVPENLGRVRLPAFTLQPVVENAIKHGTSQLLRPGHVSIKARQEGEVLVVDVEDNAGLYEPKKPKGQGLGMSLVDRRIKNYFGPSYGVNVEFERDVFTRITIRVPLEATSK